MSAIKDSIASLDEVLRKLRESAMEASRQRRLGATTSEMLPDEVDALLDRISVQSDAIQMYWTDLKSYLGGFLPCGGCTVGYPIDKETGRCSGFRSRYKFGMHACGSCTNWRYPHEELQEIETPEAII